MIGGIVAEAVSVMQDVAADNEVPISATLSKSARRTWIG